MKDSNDIGARQYFDKSDFFMPITKRTMVLVKVKPSGKHKRMLNQQNMVFGYKKKVFVIYL